MAFVLFVPPGYHQLLIQGDQRELRKSKTLLLRLRGSVGTKTYGKISLRTGHFDIWLLKYQKKTVFVKIEVCGEIVRFSHIGENIKENLINLRN